MKREVVQDFLNLPGIAGVALMDGRSRPYYCGIDQTLNFQQKEALAQGIQQVVETTPAGFEMFEFQFTGYQVHIYKLDHGIILLVLTASNLIYSDYAEVVEHLKTELQDDISNAIATFRLLAGNVTLSSQSYWKRRSESSSSVSELSRQSTATGRPTGMNTSEQGNGVKAPAATAAPHQPSHPLPGHGAPAEAGTADISLKELLVALNHLSRFTTQYLGTTVVANYWRSSCPNVEWLSQFQVDRSTCTITFAATSPTVQLTSLINTDQHQWIRDWTSAFIQRCSKVIRDFPSVVEQRALDERQKFLLLRSMPSDL